MSFFFQAEDGIRAATVTGVQTCALPIYRSARHARYKASMPNATNQSGQRAPAAEAIGILVNGRRGPLEPPPSSMGPPLNNVVGPLFELGLELTLEAAPGPPPPSVGPTPGAPPPQLGPSTRCGVYGL